MKSPTPLILAISIALLLTSCSANDKGASGDANTEGTTVLISTAASAKDAIEALKEDFSKELTADVNVNVNPGASNSLATQIIAGAPADLFLAASQEWADKIEEAGLSAEQVRLLSNRLVLVVPKANPANINEPNDLAATEVKKLALAGENVPAGQYADQALEKLGLLDGLINEGKIARGQDVRTALAYVERGEAEAGIVYATDVLAATNVIKVHDFDPALHGEIVYILVLLKRGENNPAARQFYDFLQSAKADAVYQKFGFERQKGAAQSK